MGFQSVNSLEADVTYALGKKDKTTGKTAPNSVEGYYLGSRTTPGTKYGDSVLHIFQTSKGNVGVWGKTDMNRKLGAVKPGTMTRVSANGTKSTPKGDMNVFKVEVDNEQSIEVSLGEAPANNVHNSNEPEDYAEAAANDGYGDTDDDSDDTAFEPEFVQARTASAQANADKVKALLNRNKK